MIQRHYLLFLFFWNMSLAPRQISTRPSLLFILRDVNVAEMLPELLSRHWHFSDWFWAKNTALLTASAADNSLSVHHTKLTQQRLLLVEGTAADTHLLVKRVQELRHKMQPNVNEQGRYSAALEGNKTHKQYLVLFGAAVVFPNPGCPCSSLSETTTERTNKFPWLIKMSFQGVKSYRDYMGVRKFNN